VWLVVPVIGLLERAGLKERARTAIAAIPAATTGRVLMIYFALRQITAALGLTSLGGHAQMVRPLVAPMAEAAAENRFGALPQRIHDRIRAHSAAVDNIAVFFGEDIFIAIGSILLIKGFLDQSGVHVEPAQLALWAIPTAVAALMIHFVRLVLLDRSLRRALTAAPPDDTPR
jgi:Predicted membrane protein